MVNLVVDSNNEPPERTYDDMGKVEKVQEEAKVETVDVAKIVRNSLPIIRDPNKGYKSLNDNNRKLLNKAWHALQKWVTGNKKAILTTLNNMTSELTRISFAPHSKGIVLFVDEIGQATEPEFWNLVMKSLTKSEFATRDGGIYSSWQS